MKRFFLCFFAATSLYATTAELPRLSLNTTYSLPTGGTLWTPMTAVDFQTALDSSSPGDVIQLQAGTTYDGPFTLPDKVGSSWVYVVTSSYTQLPAPGHRVSPSDVVYMPTIRGTGSPVIALQTAVQAHHFRFVGIEFKPQAGTFATTLIRLGTLSETTVVDLPTDIVFDRVYVHGDPTLGGRRGLGINSINTSVIDSYFSDWKENGGDAQAICGWNGPGPFKIVNNYLEGAAENLLFGGDNTSITGVIPTDIEVVGNYFYKPLAWRAEPWSVKNLFEIKNARRILINGNIFENMWDAAQGTAINLKSTNPGSTPWVVMEDVTFTNNIIKNVSAGIKVCGPCDGPNGGAARMNVSNNLFIISSATYAGTGAFWDLINGVEDLVIDHNTAINDGNVAVVDGGAVSGFVFTNNISNHGPYGVKGTGYGVGTATLDGFFPGYTFQKNIIVEGSAGSYPANNFFPSTYTSVGFVDYNGADYTLREDDSLRTNLIAFWDLSSTADTHSTYTLTAASAPTFSATTGVDLEADSYQYLSTTDNSGLSTGDIDFTFNAWVKPESLDAGQPNFGFPFIASKGWLADFNANQEWGLVQNSAGNPLQFAVASGANVYPVTNTTGGVLSTGVWYMVTAWHDSINNLIGIALNAGTPDTVSHSLGVNDGTRIFTIGAWADGIGGLPWDGNIRRAGFWKRVLTSGERTTLYNGGSALSYVDISSSPYVNAGTDGEDVGVNMTTLEAATACVLAGTCVSLYPAPVSHCN
jgi:hypothetical protein